MKRMSVFVAIILIMALILGSAAMAESDKKLSAIEKYRKARQTVDQDSVYFEAKDVVNTVKELKKQGKVGIDDYKAGMDYILGDGWLEKYDNDIEAAYNAVDSLSKRYFGDDDLKNAVNFVEDIIKNGYAEGSVSEFEMSKDATVEDIAEKFGASTDVIYALIGLINSYSFEHLNFYDKD